MKTPERSHGRRSGVLIVNFKYISHLFLVLLLLTLSKKILAGYELQVDIRCEMDTKIH